jgi:catecholate siderophore receptor
VRRLLVLVLACLIGFSFTAAAQPRGSSRSVTGTVIDSSGGAAVGATVVLTAGGRERSDVADTSGRFTFTDVPDVPATVTVSLDRFTSVTVDAGPARGDLRIVLQPAPLFEDVVVHASADRIRTATKTETPLRDIPQAVSVVSKKTMADLNMTSMADVVRYVPGVGYAQGEGNRDTPVFRGNSSTSDFYVDGVRDDVQYYRDVYNVERVEALKGPNAMIFGRGGVGGVINRVQRVADWMPGRELSLQTGSYDNRRVSADVNQPVSSKVSVRLTGMYENTDTYRSGVGLERYGVNPTIAVSLSERTIFRAGYERFHDHRNADRGVPSFEGRPLLTDASTFFGNANLSEAVATANSTFASVEHRFSDNVILRNRVTYGDYSKFYQNIYPGAVNGPGTTVSISGYNNDAQRQNLFNQADVTMQLRTGRIDHSVLGGLELGRQETDNFRSTAFFTTLGPAVTTVNLPVTAPTTSLPVEFRQSATDADNHGLATVAAVYAQDQITLTQQVQAVVGLRYDDFNVDFHNNRTNADVASHDDQVSPRLGLVYKPITPVSIYGSYSLSFQPRAGEQLSSLSLTNQALDPEKFRNYEVGLKWDFFGSSSFTAAAYDLERSNIAITDPNNPGVSLLVDGQRTRGLELGLSGNVTPQWSVLGAYAYQDGKITRSLSATAPEGAILANLPKNSFSLWNRYDVTRAIGMGVGLIYRSDIFTATDNTVVLPAYFRADAAAFWTLTRRVAMQVNVENLFGEDYYLYANGNNNITPGSPRAFRLGLTTRF